MVLENSVSSIHDLIASSRRKPSQAPQNGVPFLSSASVKSSPHAVLQAKCRLVAEWIDNSQAYNSARL